MKPIIRVENLSKQYRIGAPQASYGTLRDSITNVFTAPFKNARNPKPETRNSETLWALKDINFEVMPGEVVGIIGRNGAGKSTLLKILSRITEPTTGRVDLYGRVGSLLEVGTGFHPELTGRENIYLNGAVLGMKREEIRRRFDEIVGFAEVEKFLDTSVKHYSSGMFMRLAFAVAAYLDPEILIVDEVLAVGDSTFQKKCLGKMEDIAGEGRTVLFVSHNMQVLSTITCRSLMLSRGRFICDGPTDKVISAYLNEEGKKEAVYIDAIFDEEPRVTRVEVRTSEPGNTHIIGTLMEVEIEITVSFPINGAAVSFQIINSLGNPIIHLLTLDAEIPMCREAGIYKLVCQIPEMRLYIGNYTLTVHFSERPGGRHFQSIEGICPFEVVSYGQLRDYYWKPGTCAYIEDSAWGISKATNVNG